MIRKKHLLLMLIFILLVNSVPLAQTPLIADPQIAPVVPSTLTLTQFLSEVTRANLELAAQRANIPIFQGQILTARILPEPSITGGIASFDLSRNGSPTTTTIGITVPYELGRKREARVAAATEDLEAAKADLDDFFRNLRANGANAFIDALSIRLVLNAKKQTLANLQRLVDINKERLRVGDVGEIAVVQSRVEAEQFQSEVMSAEADVRTADIALRQQLSNLPPGAVPPITPMGNLNVEPRFFNLEELVAEAKQVRPDVSSKRHALEAARVRVRLARANLKTEIDFSVNYQHTNEATGEFAAPSFNSLSATVSVPIPFFKRRYPGELEAAFATEKQAELQLHSVEIKVAVEVRQALIKYDAAVAKLKLYNSGLIKDATRVYEATLYAYARGGATLLEVLDAQRKINEIKLAYTQAIADHARALVGVEQAAGTWDIEF